MSLPLWNNGNFEFLDFDLTTQNELFVSWYSALDDNIYGESEDASTSTDFKKLTKNRSRVVGPQS